MAQLVSILYAIDKVHTEHQRTLGCEPGSGGFNQVYEPNYPTPSCKSICGIYDIFPRCTIMSLW